MYICIYEYYIHIDKIQNIISIYQNIELEFKETESKRLEKTTTKTEYMMWDDKIKLFSMIVWTEAF